MSLVTDVDHKKNITILKPTTKKCSKTGEITPAYDTLLAENQDRLISDTGIQLRMNRSIQVEGAFGVLKQDLGFRRFYIVAVETCIRCYIYWSWIQQHCEIT